MEQNSRFLRYLFYLYIFLLPWLPPGWKWKGVPLSADLILAVLGVFYLGTLLSQPEARLRFRAGWRSLWHDYLGISLGALALIMLLSISYALEKKLALSESLRFLSYLFLFFVLKFELGDKPFVETVQKLVFLLAGCLGVFGIWQYFTGYGLSSPMITQAETFGARARIAATLDNPNSFAAFLILVFFPALMLTIYYRRQKKGLLYGGLSLLVLINMILTFSRNALVGLAVGCFVLILIYSWRLIFVFGAAGLASLLIPQVERRFRDIMDPNQDLSRFNLWHIALKMIKDHPLFGVGNANFVSYYDAYVVKYPEYADYHHWTRYPVHNSYLKMQSELGIPGTVAFLSVLISSLLKVKQLLHVIPDRKQKAFFTGFLAAMAAFFIMNSFDNLLFVPKVASYFWTLLALAEASACRLPSENNTVA